MAIAVIVVLVFATAMSGAIFKPGAWYETLTKPSWTPPNWAFPVVWTILYIMIGIAGWLVWNIAGFSLALVLWVIQLVLNAAWSGLFFGLRRMDLAFVDACALWLAVAAFIVAAFPISVWAALLFLPYLVWATIAAVLNLTVWKMNADVASSNRAADASPSANRDG